MSDLHHPHRSPDGDVHRYRVQVGMTRVTVASATPQEAIVAARRQLCHELPRMWDVIQQMDASRFNVEFVE